MAAFVAYEVSNIRVPPESKDPFATRSLLAHFKLSNVKVRFSSCLKLHDTTIYIQLNVVVDQGAQNSDPVAPILNFCC